MLFIAGVFFGMIVSVSFLAVCDAGKDDDGDE